MSDEIKKPEEEIKKPEEIVESVKTASPEPPKVLSESDLNQVVGGNLSTTSPYYKRS